jgi:hypothetical protein
MRRLGNSWELVKQSWAVLQANKTLLTFPIVSMVATIIISIVFAIPGAMIFGNMQTDDGINIVAIIYTFLFYLVMYTAVIFSNTALIGSALMYMDGKTPTVSDGFRLASERFGKIFGYAAIAATVGLVLNMLRNNRGDSIVMQIIGAILAGVLQFAWNLVTFLVIPVLVIENLGPIEAIKRSGTLLKQTWGEQLIGNFSVGLIFFLISLAVVLVVGLPLFLIASSMNSGLLMIVTVIVVVLAVMLVNLIGGAVGGIFQAALYRYATQGDAGTFFSEDTVRGAFSQKGA